MTWPSDSKKPQSQKEAKQEPQENEVQGHCPPKLAVEVRRGTLPSGAGS